MLPRFCVPLVLFWFCMSLDSSVTNALHNRLPIPNWNTKFFSLHLSLQTSFGPHPGVPRSLAPDPKSRHFPLWSAEIKVDFSVCFLHMCRYAGTREQHLRTVDARCNYRLYRPIASLAYSTYCADCKMFSSLPRRLLILMNEKAELEVLWRRYVNPHCFYSGGEFILFRNYS